MSFETAIYNVLAAKIAAAVIGEALFEVELLSTVYAVPSKPRAIRIGDTHADLAPGPGGPAEEFDIVGKVEILVLPDGDSAQNYIDAREQLRAITLATAGVLIENPTLNGDVNDSRILGGTRGWGNVKSVAHAAAHLHLIANETGAAQ